MKHNVYICNMYRIIALFCVLTSLLSGQSVPYVSWVTEGETQVKRLNLQNGNLDVFSDTVVRKEEAFRLNYNPDEIYSGDNGRHYVVEDGLIATFDGSGQVFKISFADSSISRLDGTHQHGYNFYSYRFERQGELMSFGGYGFWMENNLLTKFDRDAKEWFLHSSAPFPVDIETKMIIRNLRWYDPQEDILYVSHYRTLYTYDFKKDRWSAKGRINAKLRSESPVHFNLIDHQSGIAQHDGGDWLVKWRENELLRLDLSGSEEISPSSGLEGIHCMYGTGDRLVTFKRSDKLETGFFRLIHNPSSWEIVDKERLYTPYWWYKLAFYSALVLCLVVLALIIRIRIKRVQMKRKDWINFLSLSDKLLLNALRIGDLDTDEVNKILALENEGWEVQRRKRSEAIKSINAFASKALGHDIIERHKSPEDKRQVIYRLSKALK